MLYGVLESPTSRAQSHETLLIQQIFPPCLADPLCPSPRAQRQASLHQQQRSLTVQMNIPKVGPPRLMDGMAGEIMILNLSHTADEPQLRRTSPPRIGITQVSRTTSRHQVSCLDRERNPRSQVSRSASHNLPTSRPPKSRPISTPAKARMWPNSQVRPPVRAPHRAASVFNGPLPRLLVT